MFKVKNSFLKIFILLFLISFLIGYRSSATSDLKSDSQERKVVTIEINGTINPSTVDFIKTGIKSTVDNDAEALLILLDTPGGLLTSTKDIVKIILNSEKPIIVYVYPKGATATSAGVFITLSSHVAAMSPGTSIGAAHPVTIGQQPSQPKTKDDKDDKKDKDSKDIMGEKIENFASSFIESIAEERGRNVEWAIDAVRNSASITASKALEKNVIDIISPDINSLLAEINGKKIKVNAEERVLYTKGAAIEKIEMNLKQKIVNVLSTPDIAFLLLSLGSLGILIEFYNPGMIFPGVAGLISLLIGFVSLQILPFNYAGLVLIFLGIALFVAEVYVTSYGLLSLGGVISFAFGALLLFDTPDSDVRVGFDIVVATALALGLFFFFVVYNLARTFNLPAMGGFEGLLNMQGDVVSWEGDKGKVFINGEYWNAFSNDVINKGDKVRVVKSEGKLEVEVSKI